VTVLVVVVLLSLAAYQYSEMMMSEAKGSENALRSAQARALANSGIQYAAALLSDPTSFTGVLNSNPYNNQSVFGQQIVQPNDQPRFQGMFSLVAPLAPDDPGVTGQQPYTYGVIDETGKINVNALMQLDPSGQTLSNMLMQLPNMTQDIANAIIDWLDPDDSPRDGGAEGDYYSGLEPSYYAKNAPLDSLEELLLVKGVTWQLLFGNDHNRNGALDLPEEDDGTGQHDRGWSAYLTIYSRELNVDSQGNPRIYVNGSDLNALYEQLTTAVGQDLATYIVLYRQNGPYTPTATTVVVKTATTPTAPSNTPASQAASNSNKGSGTSGKGSTTTSKGSTSPPPAATSSPPAAAAPASPVNGSVKGVSRTTLNLGQKKGGSNISSLYSLINSSVSVPGSGANSPATIYPSPLNDAGSLQQLLPLLLDTCTTSKQTTIPARINVNTAPTAVLAALPYLGDNDLESIIALRPQPTAIEAPDPIFQTPAWLITEANISPATLSKLEKYITTRSQVYRVQSLGYFAGGGPTARVEAVIDTNAGQPRILYWRDLTELGKGYNLQNSQ
jgi:type II secretory pathway component PulK